jgi:hypothetical protein
MTECNDFQELLLLNKNISIIKDDNTEPTWFGKSTKIIDAANTKKL